MKALHLVPATVAVCMFGFMDVSDVDAGQMQIKPKPTQVKPQVKPHINPPKIIIRPDVSPQTKRLIELPPDSDAAKAGPQPEPPTKPAPKFEETAKSPPIPTPRPELGASSDIKDLENVSGGNMGDLKDAANMLDNGLEGQNAVDDKFRAGKDDFGELTGSDRQIGADRVGVWDYSGGQGPAFGPGGRTGDSSVDMMSRITRSRASQAPNDGGKTSGDWMNSKNEEGGVVFSHYYRSNNQGGADFRDVTQFPDGTVHITEESQSQTSPTGEVNTNRLEYIVLPPDENGKIKVAVFKNGEQIGDDQALPEGQRHPVTGFDQDGDGQPDNTPTPAPPPPPKPKGQPQATQPNPVNDGVASGICAGWSPLTGCGRPGPTLWETLTQPGSTEDSTATATGVKPITGPEAVTNPGDGASTGGNTGSGGGFGFDPCSIQAGGCGTSPGDIGGAGGGPASSN